MNQFLLILKENVKLAGVRVGQAFAQLTHIRRLNVLKRTWGPSKEAEARSSSILKKAYEDKAFSGETKLFGEKFPDIVKNYAASARRPSEPAAVSVMTIPSVRRPYGRLANLIQLHPADMRNAARKAMIQKYKKLRGYRNPPRGTKPYSRREKEILTTAETGLTVLQLFRSALLQVNVYFF